MFMSATLTGAAVLSALVLNASALDARVQAVSGQGQDRSELLYTIAGNRMRIERTETNQPHVVDIVVFDSNAVTLVFPQNHGFIQFSAEAEPSPGLGATNSSPGPPPGLGNAGPFIPPPVMEKLELQDTGRKTNLLGFECKLYELKQRGRAMEIWATDQLPDFEPYVENQQRRFKPHFIEDQWQELLRAKKLFPLLVKLRMENGSERMSFEVQSITPQHFTEEDMKLFAPPAGYTRLQPLPF
jgi:hypothetical protein